MSQSNAAIAAVLELPEVLQAIENGEDVTTQIVGALGSVLGGYAGTTIGVAAAGAIAGFIGGIIALPAVAVVGGTVAAGVIGGFLVGSVTETLFENAAGGNLFGSLIDDLQDGLSNVFNLQEAQVDWRATENNLRERFSDQPEVLAPILVELATVRSIPGAGREDFINAFENDIVLLSAECFPAHISITLADQTTKPISETRVGDRVLSYDKDGNLVEGEVAQLLENITTQWVKLSQPDNPDWELTATPGHHFLRPNGSFEEIGKIIQEDGRIVDVDGAVIEVQGELLEYNAETAHLYEQHAMMKTWVSGGLAVEPEYVEGWRTYNFTVAKTHTYIANDIRVHNDSILSFLQEGDTIYALTDDLKDMAVARDVDGDGTNEIVLLDGERFVDANGGDTFLEVEQTFIPDDPNADVEALLAQFIENNPEAAGNVYDPGNGNVPGDGIPSDDIVEILTDDIGGTFSDRSFGGVPVPTLDALILAAVTGGAGALIGTLFAPLGDTTTDLNYASGDGDVSITPSGPDATAILLFILGLDASAEIVPGVPNPLGGTIGGLTLGDLIGGLDLPDLGSFDVNFGAGIAAEDVTREQVGDDLVLTIDNGDGTTSTMTLAGVYADGNADEINSITFADGTSVPLEDIAVASASDGIVNGTATADVIDALFTDADGDVITSGDDTINGLAGDDIITGSTGNDVIDGGEGVDTIDYSDATAGITVNLNQNGDPQTAGPIGVDTLTNIENVIGSNFDDRLIGSTGVNVLSGGDGDDVLVGIGGNDILFGQGDNDRIQGANGDDIVNGGAGDDNLDGGNDNDEVFGEDGADNLTGGLGNDLMDGGDGRDILRGDALVGGVAQTGGADVFDFNNIADSVVGAGRDVIRDFVQGEDMIDLADIDAISGGADDTFTFIGADDFSGTAGEIRYQFGGLSTIISADTDGDGVADFQIQMNGNIDLTSSDFVL